MNKLIIAFALLFLTQLSWSQEMRISGTIADSSNNPLPNSLATAIRMKDSLLLGFSRADKNGYFELKGIQMDTFTLVVSHPKYDERTFYIVGSPENLEIDIPTIKMYDRAKNLDEMIIYAYKDPIHFRGDTLVYIADSFKVGPNAVVEDLLKKLPGIEVDQDGKIKSQGQDIKKVLVDGDEFFGSDPTIATKNLGANAIDKVEIYEKTDDGQFGSEDKIKVLDLRLKDNAKKGYFGKVSGASDFGIANIKNPFYEGEVLFNHFNSTRKISIFGLGTNTPRSNFNFRDANRFGLENERADGNFFDPNARGGNTSGIPRTLKAGIYFTDKVGKKKNTKIGFNYSYYNTELKAYSGSRTQFFLPDTTYFTDDSTSNLKRTESHVVNFNVESQLDSLTKLTFKPYFRADKEMNDNNTLTNYLSSENVVTLESFVNNKNKSLGLNGGATLSLNRKFMKPRREINFDYYFDYDDSKTDGGLLSRQELTMFPSFNKYEDQKKHTYNKSMENNVFASYTEPIGKWFIGTVMYNYKLENIKQDRKTYNLVGEEYSDFDPNLSNDFKTDRNEHKAGLKFQFDKGKHSAFVRVDVRNVDIDNINLISNIGVHQNITNVLPSARYQFKPSMSKQVQVNYNTYSNQPSVNDLQPVLDNSNPNRIRIGNPDLKPNYVHSVNAWFNTWSPLKGSYIWAGTNISVDNNAFVSSTAYDSLGRMVTKTVNVDGNFYSSVYGGGGIPLKGKTIQLHPSATASYNQYSSFINDERNRTNHFMVGAGGEFRFQWDSLEFNVGGRYDWNSPKSSLSSVSNTPYGQQTYSGRLTWRIPLGFEFKTDFRWVINNKLTNGYNINSFVWNAEFSKSFLKTQNLILSIHANDILNQSINAGRTVSGNMVVDNRTKIISRYFLLKLTYKFNNNKTREDEPRMHF